MARGPTSNNSRTPASNSSMQPSSSASRLSPATSRISQNPSTSESGENAPGLFARLQSPEALEYMRYFVLLNSLFVLFVMGIPYFTIMALIILMKVVVALSVLLWYGANILRFVNDYFHSQFRKELEAEFSRHPEMRNSKFDLFDVDDDGNLGDGDGAYVPNAIIESNGEMDARKRIDEEITFPTQIQFPDTDNHYDSVPETSQSGGLRRAQKPQSGLSPPLPPTEPIQGEWSPSAFTETTGGLEETVDDSSSCPDCTLRKSVLTRSANLFEEHGPTGDPYSWNNNEYCAAGESNLKSEPACYTDGMESPYRSDEPSYKDFHQYVEEMGWEVEEKRQRPKMSSSYKPTSINDVGGSAVISTTPSLILAPFSSSIFRFPVITTIIIMLPEILIRVNF